MKYKSSGFDYRSLANRPHGVHPSAVEWLVDVLPHSPFKAIATQKMAGVARHCVDLSL
jgi:hypothetical protein